MMKAFIRNNALSLAFLFLFLFSLSGQVYFGHQEYNKELTELGGGSVSLSSYLVSGHFLESTFENWESEFLQMALYIILTIFLVQKGSSESKDPEKKEAVDREPDAKRKGAPWPVRKGGWFLLLYKYSLTLVFILFFAVSFGLHFWGSLKDQNVENTLNGKPVETVSDYIIDSRFWFESFQNWQSEFLSVFAIIILSIYLRQQGSPQSKPVDAPNAETGK